MITVFGSINMDLLARCQRLPRAGETVVGLSFATAAGGKGANQALAAARAGATTAMAGAVGRDAFANDALSLLGAANVDLGMVRRIDGPTGTATIVVSAEGGENMIVVIAGANGHLDASDAQQTVAAMAAGDTLLLQLEIPTEAVASALAAAREKGVRTILNVAPLTEDAVRLAAMADLVVANESEFALLAGADGLSGIELTATMEAMSRRDGRGLVVTLGADGVVAARRGETVRAAGLKIEPVDTVGAGDTFCGYLAAGLDSGLDFAQALRRAAIAGSLACLKPGAQPAIPIAAEVEEKL